MAGLNGRVVKLDICSCHASLTEQVVCSPNIFSEQVRYMLMSRLPYFASGMLTLNIFSEQVRA
ncbi:hypothetical protein CFP56_015686 [Quercus suber]|uniref:Uncharacterized protein n=1 Tax=Quercus suber TaxID=58331 RepID=A0AAW0KPC8_QUESU